MKIADWLESHETDRARFDAVTFGWPPEQATALRERVALILDELKEARQVGTLVAARTSSLRREPVGTPQLLARSRVGEALSLLIAAAVRDEGQLDEDQFDALLGVVVEDVGLLKDYQRRLLRAVAVAEHLVRLGLDVRTVALDDEPALLGQVVEAAFRWPVWTFEREWFERAVAADTAVAKLEHLVEVGFFDVLAERTAPAGPPPPSSTPGRTTYSASGVPQAPPPPPPKKKD